MEGEAGADDVSILTKVTYEFTMVECPYCSFCFLSIFHAVSQYCAFIFLIAFFFCQPLLFEHPCAYSPTGICQAQSWLDAALQAGQGTCSSCMNVLLLVV
jgi:hypothetical protein